MHSATKTRAKQGFHTVQYARIQRDRGPDPPPPPPPPPKIIKLPSLHSMLEHHRSASETPFKWRFAFCGIWIHSTQHWKFHLLTKHLRHGCCKFASVQRMITLSEPSSIRMSHNYHWSPLLDFYQASGIVKSFKDFGSSGMNFLRWLWIQTTCVKVIARGQSSPLHMSCDVRFLPTMWYFDKCRLRWVCSTPTSVSTLIIV